jgi:hypothetical protein
MMKSETFLPNIVDQEKTRESTYTKSFKPSDVSNLVLTKI